jgi:hypothetical protein
MFPRRIWNALIMIMACVLLTLIAGFSSFSVRDWQFWMCLVASLSGAVGVVGLWPRTNEADPEVAMLRNQLSEDQTRRQQQTEVFEKARMELLTVLETRTQRLDERERDLVAKFARFHEFLEYPAEDLHTSKVSGELQKLSEQDREVHKLLEAEAERVYEKIRRNGYTVEGRVDALAIRDEALELIKKVARVYKPESEFPLLETSFEQLARAASRICLHTLVLLEQLPVNVQHYNINTLYGYIRKAVVGYGVYQKATPWFTYLSRGIYAGRMVATTNPATLGAWWLATELGKRGAKMVVENVVDRQAIAVLHNLVAIVGVEAAGIYGTGFRQRDPSWMLGTELVELIHSFPASAECLKFGLQKVTALPMRSEYDRIYLYRCLASHKSPGLQLSDSAMLSRDQREAIARVLELFFTEHIHGASEANIKRWREGFERRFDLRLKLDASNRGVSLSKHQQVEQSIVALAQFLTFVLNLDEPTVVATLRTLRTFTSLPDSQRMTVLEGLESKLAETSFEPPELDPAAEVTKLFLQDLATCAAVSEQPVEHVEQLVRETWSYFRHTSAEAQASLDAAWKQKLRWSCLDQTTADDVSPEATRAFFNGRLEGERLVFAYNGLSIRKGETTTPLPGHWLFGVEETSKKARRVFATSVNATETIEWNADVPLTIERVSGMLLDDAAIPNGRWISQDATSQSEPASDTGTLNISGSLRGGRYRSYFRPLLEFGS